MEAGAQLEEERMVRHEAEAKAKEVMNKAEEIAAKAKEDGHQVDVRSRGGSSQNSLAFSLLRNLKGKTSLSCGSNNVEDRRRTA